MKKNMVLVGLAGLLLLDLLPAPCSAQQGQRYGHQHHHSGYKRFGRTNSFPYHGEGVVVDAWDYATNVRSGKKGIFGVVKAGNPPEFFLATKGVKFNGPDGLLADRVGQQVKLYGNIARNHGENYVQVQKLITAQPSAIPSPPVRYQTFPVDVVGEVVDVWCYESREVHGGKGPEHLACALKCAAGGVVLGVLDKRGVCYIGAKTDGGELPQTMLAPYIAKQVRMKGTVAVLGSMRIVRISSVSPA